MSGFKSEEIVRVQGKDFPVLGGRLRIAHELYKEKLSIQTELVEYRIDQFAVVRAKVETPIGVYSATGTATAARDPKLSDSLLELAESRACARALRLSGVGAETCGYEEIGEQPIVQADPAVDRGSLTGAAGRIGGAKHRPLATGAQKRAITSLTRRLGREVNDVIRGLIPGADLESLTLSDASSLIDRLKGQTGNGHATGHVARD